MTTPDTLPECQQRCERLETALWDVITGAADVIWIANSFQLAPAELTTIARVQAAIGRGRRALALAGTPPAGRMP